MIKEAYFQLYATNILAIKRSITNHVTHITRCSSSFKGRKAPNTLRGAGLKFQNFGAISAMTKAAPKPTSLPPNVNGPITGFLELSLKAFSWSTGLKSAGVPSPPSDTLPHFVLLWWGESPSSRGVWIQPLAQNDNNKSKKAIAKQTHPHTIKFPIKCRKDAFVRYLKDMNSLVIKCVEPVSKLQGSLVVPRIVTATTGISKVLPISYVPQGAKQQKSKIPVIIGHVEISIHVESIDGAEFSATPPPMVATQTVSILQKDKIRMNYMKMTRRLIRQSKLKRLKPSRYLVVNLPCQPKNPHPSPQILCHHQLQETRAQCKVALRIPIQRQMIS